MNPIYEFLDSGLLGILLQILAIGVSIFLLAVLYRAYIVLGLVFRGLKALRFYRRNLIEALTEFRLFCMQFNKPENEPRSHDDE